MQITPRRWLRWTAVLFGTAALGCSQQDRTLGPPQVRLNGEPSGQPQEAFFKAWSGTVQTSPIPTAVFGLVPSQYRIYVGMVADQPTLDFAGQYPGRLYVVGDEPETSPACIPPTKYDSIYHDFVVAIRGADPTARVSPAGFSEYNPPFDQCGTLAHSTTYAQQFYDAYVAAYGSAPPVDEWRFHDFGLKFHADTTAWKARVDSLVSWSVNHGAKMVLGSFGFTNENWESPSPVPLWQFLVYERQMLLWLQRQPNINQAIWWAYGSSMGYTFHPLYDDVNHVQTQEGQAYQFYPPAQIPTGVTAVGAANYGAKLQWTNTSTTWPLRADFYVKHTGSGSFVFSRSVYVGAGATDTGFWGFASGDQVKGLVLYYNGSTAGESSAYSNTILVH